MAVGAGDFEPQRDHKRSRNDSWGFVVIYQLPSSTGSATVRRTDTFKVWGMAGGAGDFESQRDHKQSLNESWGFVVYNPIIAQLAAQPCDGPTLLRYGSWPRARATSNPNGITNEASTKVGAFCFEPIT